MCDENESVERCGMFFDVICGVIASKFSLSLSYSLFNFICVYCSSSSSCHLSCPRRWLPRLPSSLFLPFRPNPKLLRRLRRRRPHPRWRLRPSRLRRTWTRFRILIPIRLRPRTVRIQTLGRSLRRLLRPRTVRCSKTPILRLLTTTPGLL